MTQLSIDSSSLNKRLKLWQHVRVAPSHVLCLVFAFGFAKRSDASCRIETTPLDHPPLPHTRAKMAANGKPLLVLVSSVPSTTAVEKHQKVRS